MNLEEFITKYVPLSTSIAVFTNIDNEQLFEGEARELYNHRYGYNEDDDETLTNVLLRTVSEIEPDYNYAGWLVIAVD
jgi:hypothetical protein